MSRPSHRCMEHRIRGPLAEGDDVIVEQCSVCGKVRMECKGHRPMAWYLDRSNPTGYRYAYDDPQNWFDGPNVWKHLTMKDLSSEPADASR
jgi:hypothetical protein